MENVARNQEKMDSLCLRKMSTTVQPVQPNKRTKRTHNTSDEAIEPHNLRPRPQRDNVETTNEQIIDDPDYEVVGEFLCDNEDLHSGTQKRNGRGITTMNDIFSRTVDMPKIKITVNEFGQPVGENAKKFASVIGCQVRKKIPVRFTDWRAVHLGKKLQVWDDLQVFYDVDEAAKKWFMDTAARKWKDYKADLKEKFFDETLTDEQMKERLKNILNDDDFNDLIKFWRSPECQARTERGKANRAKLRVHHTSGSISHACCSYNLVHNPIMLLILYIILGHFHWYIVIKLVG
ncbi:hypothetical protein E2562_036487 [Oryza meyeriana var. granulata]|uniref:Uncharacterized protein n=1 Tax=Oryza meyeriana var. granulata TaxID=110450 RepID=A0A6G1DTE6_9ORYZ|nr:hypothetical protein E2562_036487 [Oryza meyeriana var. granulata]